MSDSDWRLTNQQAYFTKAILRYGPYVSRSGLWDHDHCSFCWAKFPAEEQWGYVTVDGDHWIADPVVKTFGPRLSGLWPPLDDVRHGVFGSVNALRETLNYRSAGFFEAEHQLYAWGRIALEKTSS